MIVYKILTIDSDQNATVRSISRSTITQLPLYKRPCRITTNLYRSTLPQKKEMYNDRTEMKTVGTRLGHVSEIFDLER
jgi:hypothetical protein